MKYIIKNLSDYLKVTGIVNVHFFEFPEGYHTLPDSHEFYELIFVSSGKIIISSDDYNGILEKHQMIIHRPNEVHSLKCENTKLPTAIIIGFTCDGRTLNLFSRQPVRLNSEDVRKLAEIIKEGRNVFAPPYNSPLFDMKKKENPPAGSEQMLRILIEYFLINLIRKFNKDKTIKEPLLTERFSIGEIKNYLIDNFKEKISLDEIAFIFKTNRSTLCKEFKIQTNKTVMEFINELKIKSAKQKILSTEKTLTEIAEEEGFESIHYFTRFFKKQTGVSPNEFRKNQATLSKKRIL